MLRLEMPFGLPRSQEIVVFLLMLTSCGSPQFSEESRSSCTAKSALPSLRLSDGDGTWTTAGSASTRPSLPVGAGSSADASSGGCAMAAGDVAAGSPSASSDSTSSDYAESASAKTDAMPSASGDWTSSGGGGNHQVGPRILTAGTFDDSLNLASFEKVWSEAAKGEQTGERFVLPPFSEVKPAQRYSGSKRTKLELAFVVDTTGSMGDELAFVNAELDSIVSSVKASYPDVQQSYSLIVYRDDGDTYVTKGIELTRDISKYKSFLAEQSAGGGGDYPEAMHVALKESDEKLQWGGDDVAKVLFLIADAPPHDKEVASSIKAIDHLTSKGVHIYPVAASGVADLAEKVMRYSALVSGGEYVFLTDDSGVGNAHAEPHIPCYDVRKLAVVMADIIKSEIAQKKDPPEQSTIIRSVGKSDGGKCLPAPPSGQ